MKKFKFHIVFWPDMIFVCSTSSGFRKIFRVRWSWIMDMGKFKRVKLVGRKRVKLGLTPQDGKTNKIVPSSNFSKFYKSIPKTDLMGQKECFQRWYSEIFTDLTPLGAVQEFVRGTSEVPLTVLCFAVSAAKNQERRPH